MILICNKCIYMCLASRVKLLISMLMLQKNLVQIVHVIEKSNIKNDKKKIFIFLYKVGRASWIKNSKCKKYDPFHMKRVKYCL